MLKEKIIEIIVVELAQSKSERLADQILKLIEELVPEKQGSGGNCESCDGWNDCCYEINKRIQS